MRCISLKKAPGDWVNILTGETLQARTSKRGRSLPLAQVLGKFPVALLTQG